MRICDVTCYCAEGDVTRVFLTGRRLSRQALTRFTLDTIISPVMERALEAGGPHVRMFYELLVDVIGLGEAFVLRPRGFVLTAEDASLWDNGTTDAVLYALRDAYLFEAIAYHEKRPPRS